MQRKKFLLGFLFFILLFTVSAQNSPDSYQCCVGVDGCQLPVGAGTCAPGTTGLPFACDQVPQCDEGICCQDINPAARSTTRGVCEAVTNTPSKDEFIALSEFSGLPVDRFSDQADSYCTEFAGIPSCSWNSCEQSNSNSGELCRCAFTILNTSETPYCCADDNFGFSNQGACSISSCAAQTFTILTGYVKKISGENELPISGATVSAGGKTSQTNALGKYEILLLPTGSTLTIIASFGGKINSTTVTLSTAEFEAPVIFLTDKQITLSSETKCFDGVDDDGDGAIDACDSDCGIVTTSIINPIAEEEGNNFCSDFLDNDCDGLIDAQEVSCQGPVRVCGDNVVQFPNTAGQFEQCDATYRADGSLLNGSDNVCPGRCAPPGTEDECTCVYQAACGNGIIDEPQEECDGIWDSVNKLFISSTFKAPAGYSQAECGIPGSAQECQLIGQEFCGDGILQYPAEICEAVTAELDEFGNVKKDAQGKPILLDILQEAQDFNCIDSCNNCNCKLGPSCGNGFVEPGEDCDGKVVDGQWDPDTFLATRFGANIDNCALKGEPNECTAPPLCHIDPKGPSKLNVSAIQFEKIMKIKWEDECISEIPEKIEKYLVRRCTASEGERCDPSDETTIVIDKSNTFYDDSNVVPGRTYCWAVQGVYALENTNLVVPEINLDEASKTVVCAKVGNLECINLKKTYPLLEDSVEEFCGAHTYGEIPNVRFTCDKNNFKIPISGGDCDSDFEEEQICVGPFSTSSGDFLQGKTACVPAAVCDQCSRPFGVFGRSTWSEGSYVGIASIISLGIEGSCAFPPLSNVCYEDASKLNVDIFKSVSPKTSCYDFNSQVSCVGPNPKSIISDSEQRAKIYTQGSNEQGFSNCEWLEPYESGETGFGVCRPVEIESQDCSKCHDPQSKWFGKCNFDTCALYGRCYYDAAGLNPNAGGRLNLEFKGDYTKLDQESPSGPYYQCRPESEIGCFDYDTQEDCIGSDSPYSTDGMANSRLVNVSIAVQGNMADFGFGNFNGELLFTDQTPQNYFNKTSGSHELLTPSDDYFGFGKCQWGKAIPSQGPRCFRNADNSGKQITSGIEIYTEDCGYSSMGKSAASFCEKDFTNPNTSIITPSRVKGEFEIIPGIEDNSMQEYGSSDKWPITYTCITNQFEQCYPNIPAKKEPFRNVIDKDHIKFDVQENSWKNETEKILISNYYELFFFSEDYSHNLEEVKSQTIYVDSNAPVVNVLFENISFETTPDQWRTNLNITIDAFDAEAQVLGEDLGVTCSAWLTNDESSKEGDVQEFLTLSNAYGTHWDRPYTFLEDGEYTYTVSCVDDVENEELQIFEFTIDGDKSLTKSKPSGTLTNQGVTLSVETAKDATCYYLESAEPIDEFELADYDGHDLLPLMKEFENTKGTYHSQPYSELSASRWYRFYLRCLFPDEEYQYQVKGNKGDEIRFAIDRLPPVTIINTEQSQFQGWYNQDVSFNLLCQDRFILDVYGREKQFDCMQTNYALGKDSTNWQTSVPPVDFKVTDSTFLTVFSKDGGNNTEKTNYQIEGVDYEHLNIPINIDKIPPNLSLKIFDGENQVNFLRLGIVYKVVITSNEDLIPHYIQKPDVQLILQGGSHQSLNTPINLELTEPRKLEGILFLTDNAQNRGYEGKATVFAKVADNHNKSGETQLEINVDTKSPNTPILNPAIDIPLYPARSFFEQAGFPLRSDNTTYYTNDPRIQLTGYTDELLTVSLTHTIDGIDEPLSPYLFSQQETNLIYEDSAGVIAGVGYQIQIEGDISTEISENQYLGFGDFPVGSNDAQVGPRRDYKSFGQFYRISGVRVIDDAAGAYSIINVDPALEENFGARTTIKVYDRPVPSYYFSIEPFLKQNVVNDLVLTVSDKAKNVARFPSFPLTIRMFYDAIAPKVLRTIPSPGTTAMDLFALTFEIRDDLEGSGINEDSAVLILNDVQYEVTIQETRIDDQYRYYTASLPEAVYLEGEYNVSFNIEDKAGNQLDESLAAKEFIFIVDKSVPRLKEFRLDDANKGPEYPSRWYTQNTNPTFVLDFTDDINPVEITSIRFDAQITSDGVANCTSTIFNIFTCSFLEPPRTQDGVWPDFGLKVYARKTLDDGTQTKIYELPGPNSSFEFTIDNEAPNVNFDLPSRVMDDVEIEFLATINNENHQVNSIIQPVTGLSNAGDIYVTDYSGQEYSYVWSIPDLSKTRGDEGDKDIKIVFEDLAGNSVEISNNVFMDLTPPSIDIDAISYTNVVKIGDVKYTASANVSILGSILDDDVQRIYLEPGNFNEKTQTYEESTPALLKRVGGIPKTFEINARVKGDLNEEILNEYILVVIDQAGHSSKHKVQITKDLKAPATPIICVDKDAGIC